LISILNLYKNKKVSITSDATLCVEPWLLKKEWAELANCRHENFCLPILLVASIESTRIYEKLVAKKYKTHLSCFPLAPLRSLTLYTVCRLQTVIYCLFCEWYCLSSVYSWVLSSFFALLVLSQWSSSEPQQIWGNNVWHSPTVFSSFARPSVIHIRSSSLLISGYITTHGVTLDSNLTLNKHLSSVCKSAYYSIKALCHIRPVLTCDMARAVAVSVLHRPALTLPTPYLLERLVAISVSFNTSKTALLELYFKTITIQLPPSYQNSTGFQSISKLISNMLHSRTSHCFWSAHLSVFVINTSSASAFPLLT